MVSFPPTFKDPNYASQFSFPLEPVAYKNEELSSPPSPKIDHSLEQGGGGAGLDTAIFNKESASLMGTVEVDRNVFFFNLKRE